MRPETQLFNSLIITTALVMTGCSSSSSGVDDIADDVDDPIGIVDTDDTANDIDADTAGSAVTMRFFLTSVGLGDGANLGGLPGADVHGANLAEAAGSVGAEWRAYLSTTGADGENAIERIGSGPWVNFNGVTVATDPANLLAADSNITLETAITENGDEVNGIGFVPLKHDILTGTEANGMASTVTADTTCGNWTSNDVGNAIIGHHDRVGGGTDPTSFSSAHGSNGCSQAGLQSTGGDGLFYCFAMN